MKEKQKKKLKKAATFLLNLSEAHHVKPLLEKLVERESSWKTTLSQTDWSLKWVNPGIDDTKLCEYLEFKGKLVNRFPFCKELARKDVFSDMMKFCAEVTKKSDGAAFDFVPATFTLPSRYDSKRLDEYMSANRGATFIAKP